MIIQYAVHQLQLPVQKNLCMVIMGILFPVRIGNMKPEGSIYNFYIASFSAVKTSSNDLLNEFISPKLSI